MWLIFILNLILIDKIMKIYLGNRRNFFSKWRYTFLWERIIFRKEILQYDFNLSLSRKFLNFFIFFLRFVFSLSRRERQQRLSRYEGRSFPPCFFILRALSSYLHYVFLNLLVGYNSPQLSTFWKNLLFLDTPRRQSAG